MFPAIEWRIDHEKYPKASLLSGVFGGVFGGVDDDVDDDDGDDDLDVFDIDALLSSLSLLLL
jgi:hypothetical protein